LEEEEVSPLFAKRHKRMKEEEEEDEERRRGRKKGEEISFRVDYYAQNLRRLAKSFVQLRMHIA
jgi:hypothetical protein